MKEITYKVVDEKELRLHLFTGEATELHPAILFFHGGGLMRGHPVQFYQHANYFAENGFTTASVEFRHINNPEESIDHIIGDAKSAMRYFRKHAAEWQIDSEKIVVCGGSSGGLLAASLAMVEGFDDPQDDLKVSTIPHVLVLFNPALFAPPSGLGPKDNRFYPMDWIRPNLPPTLILHGESDQIFPIDMVDDFVEKMLNVGNHCVLNRYAGGHGFFNFDREENQLYFETLQVMSNFLRQIVS